MSAIDDAIAALKANSIDEPRIGPPPTEEQVANAEARLGIQFPPSYRRFLATAGGFQLSFWEPYWIGASERQDLVEANLTERSDSSSPIPAFLIAFHNNGAGDHFCFDTSSPNEGGEFPVVFWDHELSPEENLADLAPVAADFAMWLASEVEDTS